MFVRAITFCTNVYEQVIDHNARARFVILRDKDTNQIVSFALWIMPVDESHESGGGGVRCKGDEVEPKMRKMDLFLRKVSMSI